MRKATILVTGGVANNVEFEAEVAEKVPGIRIALFDHTIARAPAHAPEAATWHKIGLGSARGCIPLEEACNLAGAKDGESIVLKLDIEGAEWEIFESTPESFWKRVSVFILELHSLHEQQLWKHYQTLLAKVNSNLIPVHVHGNNYASTVRFKKEGVNVPISLELTYINRTLIGEGVTPAPWSEPGPTPLDRPNIPDIPMNYWFPQKNVFLRRLNKNVRHILTHPFGSK